MRTRRLLPLALGTFAIGTDNFIVAGVLPLMADDLRVPLAVAGTQVAVFSIVYAVGTPILATVASGVERRRLLLASMGVFIASNLMAAVAPSFGALLVARAVAAAGAAVVSPVAIAIAAELTDPAQRGEAISIVTGGLTVSLVLGVPVGALIGDVAGWRSAFVFVALLAIASVIVTAFTLPTLHSRPQPGLRERLLPARRPDVAAALLQSFVIIGSSFIVFTYLGSIVSALRPDGRDLAAPFLLAFGIAAVAGNLLGGRLADSRGGLRTVRVAVPVLASALAALSLIPRLGSGTAAVAAAAVSVTVWGLASWAFTPAQFTRLGSMCPAEMAMVFGLNTSVIYLGSATGSLVGGAVVARLSTSALGAVAAIGEVIGMALLLTTASHTPGNAGGEATLPRPSAATAACSARSGSSGDVRW
jgi:predicted MFS family arabinose efflux permease